MNVTTTSVEVLFSDKNGERTYWKILLHTTIGVLLTYSSNNFLSSIGLSFDSNLYIHQDALFVRETRSTFESKKMKVKKSCFTLQ